MAMRQWGALGALRGSIALSLGPGVQHDLSPSLETFGKDAVSSPCFCDCTRQRMMKFCDLAVRMGAGGSTKTPSLKVWQYHEVCTSSQPAKVPTESSWCWLSKPRWRIFKELDADNSNSLDASEIKARWFCWICGAVPWRRLEGFRVALPARQLLEDLLEGA